MGLTKLNNKPIVTLKDEMSIAEFKKTAELSELERIYDLRTGRVFDDADIIDTREAE